ncbi:UDP-3-O-[3-hydroxymyristoyl] N-acetylglucosamine deacetylase [Rhodovulum sp. ES.010]|uniref:UDP-3-O-acyl-N-acetylglucosamine deacetylase n=1 Tax=Rhodovulum sp. ES.010 TaxID=1882821 RepID=UPI000927BCFA|nr:UDP-3-O-acyl-N-acetylglucosamine deacetylase [Rhodovulum sp. ES.010]SIO29663.1 UDP-3-O-[3-hydroxymyristoyl] N-acetylglucosamine deacetylase [Rhodovulum sp. ES.010]
MQTTLKSSISFSGTGLHSGRRVQVTVHPASAEYGIWFRRTDLEGARALIPARWDAVVPCRLCTKLANARAEVATVEHLMAALAGCGIHNALIEIDGPELPVMDGSAQPFVEGFLSRGLRRLAAPARVLRILEPVEVIDGDARASLSPADTLEIEFEIDFADGAIGHQRKALNMANGSFVRELCDSRTFCRSADVDAMRANGLALGGTLRNAVVVDGERVLSPGGLRHADEPVRHKMLDALGDLALAGAPILGRYRGERAGHALTNRLLRAVFARPGAFRLETCSPAMADRLPGAGLAAADLRAVA